MEVFAANPAKTSTFEEDGKTLTNPESMVCATSAAEGTEGEMKVRDGPDDKENTAKRCMRNEKRR